MISYKLLYEIKKSGSPKEFLTGMSTKAAKQAEKAKAMENWKQRAQNTKCSRCDMPLFQHPGWGECESNSEARNESKY